jgi:uncharacterized protein
MSTAPTPMPLGPTDVAELERLLDSVPAPLEPLDLMMLDGFLCGVLLQPRRIPPAQWLPHITDVDEARALPRSFPAQALHDLVARRFAELDRAIERRQWFDPWVLEPDDEGGPLDAVMPWVAGLATAIDLYPSVLQTSDERVLEGQALLYRAFDADDLEDAEALLAVMTEMEPPEDLDEVIEDLVTGVFLLADVTRPASVVPPPPAAKSAAAPVVAPPARQVPPSRPARPAPPAAKKSAPPPARKKAPRSPSGR